MTAVAPDYQQALRRLALNDEDYLAWILARYSGAGNAGTDDPARSALDDRTKRLVDLAALIAVGSGAAAIDAAVNAAFGAGASPEDIVEVLLCITPVVGSARVVSSAPHVAAAIGYDMDADFGDLGHPPGAND